MLSRQLLRSSLSKQLRPFASSSILARAPALADVTPRGVASFDAKQKEFRERTAEEFKRKSASQSTQSSPPSASDEALQNSPGTSAEPTSEDGTERKGRLNNLIYGTKEGRELDKEIEHSFSQVLARGKYVHSIVFHDVKPDKVDEYVKLVGEWYPKMAGMPENKVHLVGSWRTEVGDCDTFGLSLLPSSYTGTYKSKFISGSISATMVTTTPCTTLRPNLVSASSTRSSSPLSTPNATPLCKNSPFGPPPLPANLVVSLSYALTRSTLAICSNGRATGVGVSRPDAR